MSKQVYPTDTTKKYVLAASGNQCAEPDCMELIFDLDHETMLGQIAHITARRPEGARYDTSQNDIQRNSFPNLVALCAKHHTLIDDNEARYPTNMLYKWKEEHEQKIAHSLDRSWVTTFPSSITRTDGLGSHITMKYWIDEQKKPQVYTKEQLAVCDAMRDFFLLTSSLHDLLGNIEQLKDESHIPWIRQQANKIKLNKYGLHGTIHEYFQIARDVKFLEYTISTTEGGMANKDTLIASADKLLKEKVAKIPENTNMLK